MAQNSSTVTLFPQHSRAGSAFCVDIDVGEAVGDLKEAIKAEKPHTIKGEDHKLQLFLARATDNKGGIQWLSDESETALDLEKGVVHQDIQTLVDGEQMRATKTLQYWLFDKSKMPLHPPTKSTCW
ncbi:crn1-like protein [Phytophthora cinnamomi]|uniref:crn1-like protein n=1 Tax=Phytophthora cinnamomi TaxID=4785 RepID=UPI00355ACC46|nr:crn1-like protein [Phytophthora cinnamomi]